MTVTHHLCVINLDLDQQAMSMARKCKKHQPHRRVLVDAKSMKAHQLVIEVIFLAMAVRLHSFYRMGERDAPSMLI